MALYDDHLKKKISELPSSPGVYQYFDSSGVIIYIGKAKNLKKRVYSYFSKEHEPGKTRVLVISQIKPGFWSIKSRIYGILL